jgi:site-specific recombinase XerD
MDEPDAVAAFERYLQRRFAERRTTIDYLSDIRQFGAVCAKPWREVTMHDIDAFVDQQRQAQLQASTIKRRVAALKTYFDFLAEDSGELDRINPVRFKRHAGKQPQRLPRDLSNEAVEQLWAVLAAPRDRAWVALMLRAGLRVGEVARLQLADVLTPAQADQPARVRVLGKGQKERIVLLTADAYAVLNDWLAQRPASARSNVFLNERGQPLTTNGLEWLLHQYGAQVGLAVTPHQLRHTYARQLTEAGMPLPSLSKLMGHAHLSTTQLYTVGADPELSQAYQTAMHQLAAQPLADPAVALAQPVTLPGPIGDTPLPPLPVWADWWPDLPVELRQASLDYTRRSLATCPPQHQRLKAIKVLSQFRRFWEWQQARRPLTRLADLQLADLQTYQTDRLVAGLAAATINRDLDYVLGLLHEQADQGQPVAAGVFRLRPLPRPDALPRALTDADSQHLEVYVQHRFSDPTPRVRLENAVFFVLAHTGLRLRECADLRRQDLDLPGRRLFVHQGKGQRDRVVYLSDTAAQALMLYLDHPPMSPTAALWQLPAGHPVTLSWFCKFVPRLGATASVVHLTAHRLRHTFATRLLNAGMDITRIQKLLGHQHLNTTLIYARVSDATVEADYRRAMRAIEHQQMPLATTPIPIDRQTLPVATPNQFVKELTLDSSV